MSAWRDISTAPKDGEQMLLWDGGIIVFGWFDGATDYWRFLDIFTGKIDEFPQDQEPTHWMSLPSPPKDTCTATIDPNPAERAVMMEGRDG